MKKRIFVTLKPGVLDPQGRAVHHALDGMGFDGSAGKGFAGQHFELPRRQPAWPR